MPIKSLNLFSFFHSLWNIEKVREKYCYKLLYKCFQEYFRWWLRTLVSGSILHPVNIPRSKKQYVKCKGILGCVAISDPFLKKTITAYQWNKQITKFGRCFTTNLRLCTFKLFYQYRSKDLLYYYRNKSFPLYQYLLNVAIFNDFFNFYYY